MGAMLTGAESIRHILVIHLAFIGDIVLAMPAIKALKETFPAARLTMLTVPLTAEVAAMSPYVDEVMVYDKHGADQGVFAMRRVARRLAAKRFDLCVSMNFAVRGALVAYLAGIPRRVGYDVRHAGWFLTHRAPPKRDVVRHEALNQFMVLAPLGIDANGRDTSLSLAVPEAARAGLDAKRAAFCIPPEGYFALCPLGSYERKNLPLAVAAHVARHFGARRAVFLIGSAAERARLEEIARLAGLSDSHVLAGALTLSELAAFLERAACLITVDTGPLHIAQAVGCRTVAVFGPTSPAVWGPRGARDAVLYRPMDCSPCWGKGECKRNHVCVGGTSARDIIRAGDNRTGGDS